MAYAVSSLSAFAGKHYNGYPLDYIEKEVSQHKKPVVMLKKTWDNRGSVILADIFFAFRLNIVILTILKNTD
ncbi:hypothetical protein ATZ36_02495 [Candidatus Endomicrobiellum trichonymphae]|uniref:Uncharacterized protein n=1 Tax=Endomicrobium trichonymphae TaxID=1408204 RepID=A0A1E5IMF7_ENDTX|nr:hypothetical protein ATZ36_02495 [Candidatus Endomicrobium trichonymphae]